MDNLLQLGREFARVGIPATLPVLGLNHVERGPQDPEAGTLFGVLVEPRLHSLDLTACAATGSNDDLIYVSPKSGRAVSASAGEPYHDRLLTLPSFLRGRSQRTVSHNDLAAGFALTLPLWPAALLVSDLTLALAFLALPCAVLCFYLAPTFAAVQSLATPGTRALAAALFIMIGSVAGLGIGPLAVGMLSDALRPGYGTDSLRLAMLLIVPLLAWSAAHYHLAGRSLAADLARR